MRQRLQRLIDHVRTRPLPTLCAAAVALAIAVGALLAEPARRAPATAQAPAVEEFTNFETEPVRPLAMSPEGDRLYALNTPDDRLEIFAVGAQGLTSLGDVFVGMRPVALAVRPGGEVWVVNHLSDSISIVDASDPANARVVVTRYVGDEPRDIVVAGPNRDRVFVSAAYRGQETTPGVSRASVWVFDANNPSAAPSEVRMFGMKPRALAASPDGRQVYAAVFHSGNGSTTVPEEFVTAMGTAVPPPGYPQRASATAPANALIVRDHGDGRYVDETGSRDWKTLYTPLPRVPDKDVFIIDAAAAQPREIGVVKRVGTILFNMAVQPGTGQVWVSNTEARNHVRYEPRVRSNTHTSRVTRVDPAGQRVVSAGALNPQLDALRGESPQPMNVRSQSLAQPLDLVFQADGQRAYVAAFQSAKVGVLDGQGNVVDRIDVGFGPGGLALDEAGGRLFVLNRLDASISVVSLADHSVAATVPLRHDPTPKVIQDGRPFFYDAALTSGHGDMACSSCHVFANFDGLAWDLSGPEGELADMPFGLSHDNFVLKPRDFKFHPMKGPMMTQSLRGMDGAGPMHWRGDRHGPDADPADELLGFRQFNPAFVGLNGLDAEIPLEDMDRFGRFALTVQYPPNPIQELDRSLTPFQQKGFDLYGGEFLLDSGVANCEGCHPFPTGTNRQINFEGVRTGQDFKSPHLRNMYQKVGRFDDSQEQVSGFGFLHAGSFPTVFSFLGSGPFAYPGETQAEKDQEKRAIEDFVLAFDTGMAPIVGRQVTIGAAGGNAEDKAMLALMEARADAEDCAMIAVARVDGVERGWLRWEGSFRPDRAGAPPTNRVTLEAMAATPGGEVTFTCVPPDDGPRVALDRDRDGWLTGDEHDAGTDPADPSSRPEGEAPPQPWRQPTPIPSITPTPTQTGVPTDTPTPTITPTPFVCDDCPTLYMPISFAQGLLPGRN